jgi:U3 small nucleolar RNA-associated protein 15
MKEEMYNCVYFFLFQSVLVRPVTVDDLVNSSIKMTTTILQASSTTNDYKTSSSLQAKRHSVASVTRGQKGVSDPNEARYWTQKLGLGSSQYDTSKSRFTQPRSIDLQRVRASMVHHVLFGPPLSSSRPPLAVVGGPRVGLYGTGNNSAFTRALARGSTSLPFGGNTVDPDRQVQTGGHLALCGAFRNDGRLLAVGTDVGEVRVCDVTMRSTLSTLSASKLPVRSVEWFRNGQNILAGGDDAIGRVWDLSSTNKEKPLLTLVGHGDVIRCAALWQKTQLKNVEWNQLAMTGSYDHTVRVWNVQDVDQELMEDRCLAVLSHDAPVEAICVMESENPKVPVYLLSAGGRTIKVWNPITGQCLSTVLTQHRKTVTSLLPVIRSNENEDKSKTLVLRILTSSLDGVLQFHCWDAATGLLEHLYSTKLDESITSVAADKSGDRFAIGTASGNVMVKAKGQNLEKKKRLRDPRAGTYAFFQRGMNAEAGEGDYTVTTQGKKRKLRSFDVALKQFRYGDALDDALVTRRPRDVVAVLEELGKRRGLTNALANRDEEMLEPILSFTIRYITRPHFTGLLVGIAHRLIDIYGDVVGQSETIDELFAKLKSGVANECRAQKSLLRLVGHVDAIMSKSEEK